MKLKSYKVDQLKKTDYNPRFISDKQFEELKDSISRFGLTEPILINIHKTRKNIIISGHQRFEACLSLGWKEISCVEVNLPLKQEKELNIKMNKLGGDFNFDLLEEFFEKDELLKWGFNDYEFEGNFEFEPNTEPEQSQKDTSKEEVDSAKDKLDNQFKDKSEEKTLEVICPHCLEPFNIKT